MNIFHYFNNNVILDLIPIFLLISVPIRFFSKNVKIHYSPGFLLLLIAILFGYLITSILGPTFKALGSLHPQKLICVYFPIYVLSTVYRIDYYIFMRCLPQILLISFIGMTLRVILFFLISYALLNPDWSMQDSFAVSLCLAPIQPTHIIMLCKELSKFKYLATILEAESVISCIPVMVSLNLVKSFEDPFKDIILICTYHVIFGLVWGCLMGKLGSIIWGWLYNDSKAVICSSLGLAYLTVYVSELFLLGNGAITIFCYALFVISSKHKFTTDVDNCLRKFLSIISYAADVAALTVTSIELTRLMWTRFFLTDTLEPIITYIWSTGVRMLSFILMGSILRKMAYELKMKCVVLLGWCDVKGIINILLTLKYLKEPHSSQMLFDIAFDVFLCLLLSLAINSSTIRITFRILGVAELSPNRKHNMNSCMKYLMEKRISIINILKTNRYLCDANWKLVRSETILDHPYKQLREDAIMGEQMDDYILHRSTATCPSCYKEIPFDITEADLIEMKREAQIKIWKAKKVSVIKQFENGNINKSCLQVLTHVFEIMIELNIKNDMLDLNSYFKEQKSMACIRRTLMKLSKQTIVEPPTSVFNRFCFYLSMHVLYDYVLFFFILGYASVFISYCVLMDPTILIYVSWVVLIIFTIDFYIKIMAYTKDSLAYGLVTCLSQFWNVFDLVILVLTMSDMILTSIIIANHGIVFIFLKAIGLLRMLKIFQLLQPFYIYLLKVIEYKEDSRVCFGYDLGTAMVTCCDEVLELIPQLIENRGVRDLFTKQVMSEKLLYHKMMEMVQKERPWVAITVKTKQAIRTTLNTMEDVLIKLKYSGFIDSMEYEYINHELLVKQKMLRKMDFVQSSPPQVIFNEVSWMANDKNVIEYLYSHVELVSWNARDVVYSEGSFCNGIYIVVSGLLRIIYNPNEDQLRKLKSLGTLPIVDYMSTLHFEGQFEDNIMSGNSFGELSLLTKRPYNSTIVAESPCQAYFLRDNIIYQAMDMNIDPVRGLEARMWKYSVINLAVEILLELPTYQSFSQEQIKFKLENAFVPNIRCYKMFIMTEMIEDVILIDGIVADYYSGDVFIAPVVLPKTVQKMILPGSSSFNIEGHVETKIMIIPTEFAVDYDIMQLEEEIAELVTVPSSSCLLHKVPEPEFRGKHEAVHAEILPDESKTLFTRESVTLSSISPNASLKAVQVLSATYSDGFADRISNIQSLSRSLDSRFSSNK